MAEYPFSKLQEREWSEYDIPALVFDTNLISFDKF